MTSLGQFIKSTIVPEGMSISEAARRLGVTRAALSNLLNDKVKLSQTMARKLEETFGADAGELLRKQVKADQESGAQPRQISRGSGYLSIEATDVEYWVDSQTVSSRSKIPLLLRRLVHATTDGLTEIDFHGGEESERKGWDGETETAVGSEKVPAGKTGWELSASSDLPRKPTSDIKEREKKLSKAEREETTFVFVTARRWPGKDSWAKTHRASGAWKDVKALDADDLAQWIEQSIATQIWFAEQIGKPVDGVKSLSRCWEEWSEACEPSLPEKLFEGARDAHESAFNAWREKKEGGPLVITADSSAEALAYLAVSVPKEEADRALVVHTEDALRSTAAAVANDLIVIQNSELEPLAGPYFRSHKIVIVRPKTTVENDADIVLDQIGYEPFSQALAEMGFGHEDLSSLSAKSARSATILRRLFAKAPELKRPPWAGKDPNASNKLRPLLFAGAWAKSNAADCVIVAELAGKSYEEVERDVAELASMPDAPVWAIGSYRGITCRRDALFAAHEVIVEEDIEDFLEWAQIVLSEDDPALDLAPGERWSAGIYDKKREISGALHEAIGEMLVLLGVYGEQLFGQRNNHLASRVAQVVKGLMTDKTTRELLALSPSFQSLAEAAPDAFLECLDADLGTQEPQILPLLRSVEAGSMDSPDRTNLLWALEILAWDEAYYLRVIRILATLSQTPIDDNWMNKPESSLESLVSCWHPETTVSVDQRIDALQTIVSEFSDVGWRICLAQVDLGHRSATPNNRPTYRSIGISGSRKVTQEEFWKVVDASWDLLLGAPKYSVSMIDDLLQNIQSEELPDHPRDRFVELLVNWKDGASEKDRASIVRSFRRAGFSPERPASDTDSAFQAKLKTIASELEPSDPVERHQWLFAENYVPESRSELLDDAFDYDKRTKWIEERRTDAARAVYEIEGLDGIMRLIDCGNASYEVGRHLANSIGKDQLPKLILDLFVQGSSIDRQKVKSAVRGLLFRDGDKGVAVLAKSAIDRFAAEIPDRHDLLLELFLACPFLPPIWDLVETTQPDLTKDYWLKVVPSSWRLTAEEYDRVIDRLLRSKRPRAALAATRYDVKGVQAKTVAKILVALVEGGGEEAGTYPVDPYAVEEALTHIHERKALSVNELARLEFLFVKVLRHSKHGMPNFEERIARNPASFVELIAILYRRKDGGTDPKQYQLPEDADVSAVATNVYQVLDRLSRTPGSNPDGTIDVDDLVRWINEARKTLLELSRESVGDSSIGQLLGKCAEGADGIWPHEAVRAALERVGNERILDGMALALYNSRGAVWRGPGGDQERALSNKYSSWAKTLASAYPMSAKLLRKVAEHYEADAKWHDTDESVRKRLGRH